MRKNTEPSVDNREETRNHRWKSEKKPRIIGGRVRRNQGLPVDKLEILAVTVKNKQISNKGTKNNNPE